MDKMIASLVVIRHNCFHDISTHSTVAKIQSEDAFSYKDLVQYNVISRSPNYNTKTGP